VELDGKWNFIDTEGKLLSEQWYDYAWSFREGFATVELNRKFNFINRKGNLFYKIWRKKKKHPFCRSLFKQMFDFLLKRTCKQNL